MRVRFSSIAAMFVALLFVSGTVGCRSNGGDWYNPKSYAFTNPFANMNGPFSKENQAPPYSSDTLASTKPSADSQPNISAPRGGYTGVGSEEGVGNHAGFASGTASPAPPEHWGQQYPQMAQYGSSSDLGGYSVPEPSQYSSYSDYARQGAAPGSYPSAPQQNPYLYQPEMAQHTQSQPPYGLDYTQPNYQATSAYASQQPTSGMPPGAYGAAGQPMGQPGSYTPYGAATHVDSYASIQQPVASPPPGTGYPGYEQPAIPYTGAPYTGYPSEGIGMPGTPPPSYYPQQSY